MEPAFQWFLPCASNATEPPRVLCIDSGTTGGHQPSSMTCRHSCLTVTPGSTSTLPEDGSQKRTPSILDNSTETFSALRAASARPSPVPRTLTDRPELRAVSITSRIPVTVAGR